MGSKEMKKEFNLHLTYVLHSNKTNNSSLMDNTTFSSKDSEDMSFSEMDFSVIRGVMYNYNK
jgi:hypothetical protein